MVSPDGERFSSDDFYPSLPLRPLRGGRGHCAFLEPFTILAFLLKLANLLID